MRVLCSIVSLILPPIGLRYLSSTARLSKIYVSNVGKQLIRLPQTATLTPSSTPYLSRALGLNVLFCNDTHQLGQFVALVWSFRRPKLYKGKVGVFLDSNSTVSVLLTRIHREYLTEQILPLILPLPLPPTLAILFF